MGAGIRPFVEVHLMAKHRTPLAATFVDTVKLPGRYTDGPRQNGLFLRVRTSPAGSILKTFGQRIRIDGKLCDLGLGSYPKVTLSVARQKASTNAQLVAAGGDPRVKEKPVPTLAEAAEILIALRSEGKSADYMEQQRARLRRYVKPLLGKRVDQITREDVRSALRPSWHRSHPATSKALGLLSMVMEWAIGEDHRTDNPADDSTIRSLPVVKHEVTNLPSVPHQEVEDFIKNVRQLTNRDLSSIVALEFKILTATRSTEACGARWDEIDMDHVVFVPKTKGMPALRWPCWVIPKERYKTRRELVIPLSRQAIRILVEAIQFRHRHPYLIFSSVQGNAPSPAQLKNVQHQVSEAVPHGFRNSFKTWTQEYDVRNELAETALGHSISTHGGAYGRSILAAKRIFLMQDWADYNYGQLPPGYEWTERFKAEKNDTYPVQDEILIRQDIEVLREHLSSDIAGQFFQNLQDLFATIRAADVSLTNKLALQFLVLTAGDFVYVRKARLDDINADTGIWSVPAEHNRGKSGKPLLVPLSREALAIYRQALNLKSRGDSGLLFATGNGTPLEVSASSRLCNALHLNISPKIFISAFREWAISFGISKDVIDDALGLSLSKPLTGTPLPDTLKDRARLMQKWASFLNGQE